MKYISPFSGKKKRPTLPTTLANPLPLPKNKSSHASTLIPTPDSAVHYIGVFGHFPLFDSYEVLQRLQYDGSGR